jgi:hypothetical protein
MALLQVVENDPVELFKVEGANRTDVVYAVDSGKIYLMVYADPDVESIIT